MPIVADRDALPAGTRLGEFRIELVLGTGGFGVVYLAFDETLRRQVAIKEYLPAALAVRGAGLDLTLRAPQHADTFGLGLHSFINEARLLARFDHPALVKVYRFWEAHGTAYMAMPYYRGRTLQESRRGMSAPPPEAWLRQVIEPVLGALECLHREQVFHRDIAPDNILLLDGGEEGDEASPRPVLLDLGAARHVIGGQTQSLTAILKPSFAPIEQYAETAQLRQGAWTDLYALAAVVHFCITGRPPTPASARAVHDDLVPLQQLAPGLAHGFDRHYSASFLHAIDHALAVRPQDRPESVIAWRQELSGIVDVSARAHVDVDPQQILAIGDVGVETDLSWVAETVLVKPKGREKPPGHAVVEAQAYLTTLPAASALLNRPHWPASVAPPCLEGDAAQPHVAGVGEALSSSAELADGEADAILFPVSQLPPLPAEPTAPTSPASGVPLEPAALAEPLPDGAPQDAWHGAPGSRRHYLGLGLVATLLLVFSVAWWTQSSRVAEPDIRVASAPQPDVRGGEDTTDGPSTGAVFVVAGAFPASAPLRESDEVVLVDSGRVIDEWAPVTVSTLDPQPGDGKRLASAKSGHAGGGPRAACGDRNFFTMAICMKRQCGKAVYTQHPQCREMRRLEQGSELYP